MKFRSLFITFFILLTFTYSIKVIVRLFDIIISLDLLFIEWPFNISKETQLIIIIKYPSSILLKSKKMIKYLLQAKWLVERVQIIPPRLYQFNVFAKKYVNSYSCFKYKI